MKGIILLDSGSQHQRRGVAYDGGQTAIEISDNSISFARKQQLKEWDVNT